MLEDQSDLQLKFGRSIRLMTQKLKEELLAQLNLTSEKKRAASNTTVGSRALVIQVDRG